MCYRVRSSSEAVKSNDGQQDVPFSQLRKWCKSVKEPTVIAIDTLKRVRPPKRGDQSDYAADYEACQGLLDLVHEFPGLSVFVAHHDRKAEAADVFDTVSGTLGLTGGVDTIALLKRSQGNVTLHIEGRDLLDTVEKAVAFDRETCRWSILGEAAEIQGTEQRRRVREALRNAEDGLTTRDIRTAADLANDSAASRLLLRMVVDNQIERIKHGLYGSVGWKERHEAELKKVELGKKDRRNVRMRVQ
jgi:hypothetical protein